MFERFNDLRGPYETCHSSTKNGGRMSQSINISVIEFISCKFMYFIHISSTLFKPYYCLSWDKAWRLGNCSQVIYTSILEIFSVLFCWSLKQTCKKIKLEIHFAFINLFNWWVLINITVTYWHLHFKTVTTFEPQFPLTNLGTLKNLHRRSCHNIWHS